MIMIYSEYQIDLDEKDSQYWANMAFSLQREGKPKQAQKYYEKAIEIEPENISYLINLGSVLNAQGKHSEAVKYLRYVTKVAPDYVEGWVNLSVAYIAAGNLNEGLICCNKGLDLDPSNAVIWNNRGYIFRLQNKIENAISDYDESLRLVPDSLHTLTNKLIAHGTLKQWHKVKSTSKKILKIDKYHKDALYWKAMVNDIERDRDRE